MQTCKRKRPTTLSVSKCTSTESNTRATYINIATKTSTIPTLMSMLILDLFTWPRTTIVNLSNCGAVYAHVCPHLGSVKQKSAFEHAQNLHSDHPCACAKGHPGIVLSIHIFCSIQLSCSWTVNALIRQRGCVGWSGPSLSAYARRHVFAWRDPFTSRLQRLAVNVANGREVINLIIFCLQWYFFCRRAN